MHMSIYITEGSSGKINQNTVTVPRDRRREWGGKDPYREGHFSEDIFLHKFDFWNHVKILHINFFLN